MSEMVLSRSLALTTWLLVSLLRGISLDRTRVILKVSCGYIIFELTFTILLAVNFNTFDFHDEVNNKHVDVQANHRTVVREIGAASAVLLKNEKNALPLKKPRRATSACSGIASGIWPPIARPVSAPAEPMQPTTLRRRSRPGWLRPKNAPRSATATNP